MSNINTTPLKKHLVIYISSFILAGGFFSLISCFWIKKTYGCLLIAAANESFRNLLQNKRTLFLKEVILPSLLIFFCIYIILVIIQRKSHFQKYILPTTALLSLILLITGSSFLQTGNYIKHQFHLCQRQWYDENKIVVHALGRIDEHAYTNSNEALLNSYHMGQRAFECDLILTSDHRLVACHDWNSGMQEGFSEENVPSLSEFMNTKILGTYTPMSITNIIEFMSTHPDVYIITDSKYADEEVYMIQFNELVSSALDTGNEEVLSRFIIQIYHPYMYEDIEKIYPFSNYIFTLYQEGYKGDIYKMEEYAKFCVLHNIDTITLNEQYYNDTLLEICNRYGIQLFVHTVNDTSRKQYFSSRNIGIYTDDP